ncbi:MAG: fibronectin type III domain-containing protein [Thermoplasmata archaeon]|nr:fibronectin type III domain-containing protein [Thermoplasmata archaeon]
MTGLRSPRAPFAVVLAVGVLALLIVSEQGSVWQWSDGRPTASAEGGLSPAHRWTSAPARAVPSNSTHPHTRPLATTYPIFGNLTGLARTRTPLAGENISLYDRPCTSIAAPSTCTYVNHTSTRADGSFVINASKGPYFVVANNSSRWSGSWEAVTVSGGRASVDLLAYRWLLYGNATFVLPAWSNLATTASNCNAAYPCGTGVYGTQDPLLSWTSDGVYYVNSTHRLVFYNFANGSVRNIAPWLTLYDDIMAYQGIENTEWITADSAYVYEFGCTSDCSLSSTSPIVFYAVNTTTGQTFRHTYSSVTDGDLYSNAQIQMIGEDGNTSIAALITAAGTVYGYNLWNQTQWQLGTIPYFEANNIYWFPNLNSFLNVQADGSSSDGLDQVQLQGPAPGTSLVTVFQGYYGTNFLCNGVNGVYLNVSSHRIGVSELTGGGPVRTEFWQYDARGRLTGNYTLVQPTTYSSWPSNSAPANVYSSEHRPTMTSNGPMYNGDWDGMFGNNTWLYEPTSKEFLSPNLSFDHIGRGPNMRQSGQSPASVESLFANTTYSILSESVNCRTNGTTCPIRGTATGTVPGTVWWTWRLGLPEFPFPVSASGAETLPPGPVNLTASSNTTSITLRWSPPPTQASYVLNYTLFWGPPGQPSAHAVDLWSSNLSYPIRGLPPATSEAVCLQAWNLHWHNIGTCLNASTEPSAGALVLHQFSATPSTLDRGMSVELIANASGGLAPLSYTFSGLPNGCPSGGLPPSFGCTPNVSGVFHIRLNVTDSAGEFQLAQLTLTVNPPFAVGATIAPPVIDVGQSSSFSTVIQGSGTPPYSGGWTILGVGYNVTVGSGPPLTATPTIAGNFSVVFAGTDALGEVSWDNLTWTVHPQLSGNILAQPAAVDIGIPVTVTATAAGGTPPTSAAFGAVPVGCNPQSSGALACRIAAPGYAQVSAVVSDAAGENLTVSTYLSINANPQIVAFSPTTAQITQGTPVGWIVDAQYGTPPYSVRTSGLPPGCPAVALNTSTATCTPAAGSYRVDLTLTDSDGRSVNASTTLVVAAPAVGPGAGSSTTWWALLAAAAVAGSAVVVVWVRRRRGPPAREGP